MSDMAALYVACIFAAVIVLAFMVDRHAIKKYVPGPLLLMAIPLLLANVGAIPRDAPMYDVLVDLMVPLGVALLLLRTDVRQIVKSGGPMLGYYFIGVVASLIGLAVAALIFDFADGEGAMGGMILAFMAGSVINAVSVTQVVKIDPTLFSAVFAASVITGNAYLALIMFMMRSSRIARLVQPGAPATAQCETKAEGALRSSEAPSLLPSPLGELITVLYALMLLLVCRFVMQAIGQPQLTILAVTLVAILFGNLVKPARRVMRGDREIGLICLYIFICAIAAQIDLTALGPLAGWVLLFWTVAIAIHLAIVLAVGRLVGADYHSLLLASHAGIGGPSSTAAVAAAQGRGDLVTPGVLCALCGVVIGTFLGTAWAAIAG